MSLSTRLQQTLFKMFHFLFFYVISVGTAMGYRVKFPAWQDLSLFPGSVGHPHSYSMGIGGNFLGGKATEE
jgi:hypothetical protein